MVFKIIKEVEDIKRFNQIILVLFEEGFGYLLDKIKLKHKVPIKKRVRSKLEKKKIVKPEVRLRLTLEKLGPTFIKLGQILSVRPDLIPKEYVKELEKLQYEVPSFPFNEVEKEIKEEFGKPINKIFSSFSKKPIASASISQVHKAVLKNKKVAVKVQRPKIKEIMERDIEIMLYIARLLDKHIKGIRKYNPVGIVEEFADWTKKELDFRIEAKNAKRFYQNFKGSKTVYIPKVYDEFTTSKILTLEYIDGIEIHNIETIKKRKINLNNLLKNGFNAILTQVFVHGFFHADPHPGNILVLKNKIAFVDFGIVGYFDEDLKRKSLDLFLGVVEQDANKVVNSLLEMGVVEEASIDKYALKMEIHDKIEPLQGSKIKDIKISRILEDVLNIAFNYNIRLPMAFILFGKTIVTLEGVALKFDPDFRITESVRPFVEDIVKRRYSPKELMTNFIDSITKFRRFATKLPEQTEEVFRKIQKGNIKVDIEDTDVKQLSLEIDRSSNRMAYGMIIAALLIAGALVMQVSMPSIIGMPIITFICFLSAIILGFMLFISVLRERKLK